MRALAMAVAASGAIVAAAPPQAPDRTQPPPAGPAPALKLPAIEKRTLTNGLPVWIATTHKVPVAQLELVVRSGSAADPVQKFGLASLTADMLDEGAGSRSALEIADAIDYLGADLSTGSSTDASTIDLHVPVARLDAALPIMADVAIRPTFPPKEVDRIREERLTALVQAEDDPEQLIEFAFPRIVYGTKHRYGTGSIGTAASLKGFTADDLRRFHAAQYRPSNALLVVTGDIAADAVLPPLERAFGSWKGGRGGAPAAEEKAAQLTARRVYLIDKPGAAQSQIRIGWVGVPRSTPDYFALRVLNTMLGGAFTSRLNMNLREEHGYSYGAGSTFDMRRGAGPFYAAAGVQTDKTIEALKEFFNELRRIHDPIPEDELRKAENYLALLLPRNFESTRAMASSLAQLYVFDLPEDFYQTFNTRVHAIGPSELKRAADSYIQPDKFAIVIIGDLKTIEPGVRGLNLGPVTVMKAEDVLK